MKKREWLLTLLFIALLCIGTATRIAHAEPKAVDVLPGAFGEAIDALDGTTAQWCIKQADRALEKLLDDFTLSVKDKPREGYLQILQTTLLLPGTQPTDNTEIERMIWAENYADAACIVSFVFIDNSLNIDDVPYAAMYTGHYGDYAVRKDGSVTSLSLRGMRNRYLHDPVLPGVRVINMGSHYNAIHTTPVSESPYSVPLFEYLNDPTLITFAEKFEEDFPVSVTVRHDEEMGSIPITVTDPETIRAVFEALRNITVLGESPVIAHTDDYLNYYFEMADGRIIYGFTFQQGMLLDSWMRLYEITGFDELQKALPDPLV